MTHPTRFARSLSLMIPALTLSMAPNFVVAQDQLWIRQPGTSIDDTAVAAASDESGGVYALGSTSDSQGAQDAWLIRYDAMGNVIWTRQFGTFSAESAKAAAADGSGGVYSSGEMAVSLSDADVWLARHDAAGNELWVRQFGTSVADQAFGAAADGSGGVYVSGITWGDLGGSSLGSVDAWLARYDAAGNQLWIRQFGTRSLDQVYAAASDDSGGVYVGGLTTGDLGGSSAGAIDAWLARYDGAGNQLWVEQVATSEEDRALCAASDGAGDLFVGGTTSGSLGGPNAGDFDAWLARYDRSEIRAYCFGDGSGGACPCDNYGAIGQGCENSSGAGTVVSGLGSTSVSVGDLAFMASNLLHFQAALLFAGLNPIDGGDGAAFGDGLRCAGGDVLRLGVRLPDAQGNATFGPGFVSAAGFAAGDLRRFQVWYRDPAGSPCGSGFNLSHGMEVIFVP